MSQSSIDASGPVPAGGQTTEVLEPADGALDNPTTAIPTQDAAILMSRYSIIASSRDDRFDAATLQRFPDSVAVVTLVRNQSIGSLSRTTTLMRTGDPDRLERLDEEPDLRWGRRVHVKAERSTLAINQYHKLRSLASLGFSDQKPPFLALANVPSTKHSFQRIWSLSWSCARNARQILSSVPSSVHFSRRRWTALLEPYRGGNSLHCAPVHKIQRIPSKHRRSPNGGRPPLRSFLRHGFFLTGSRSLTFSHCASVTFLQAMSPSLSRGVGDHHKSITSVSYRRYGDDF